MGNETNMQTHPFGKLDILSVLIWELSNYHLARQGDQHLTDLETLATAARYGKIPEKMEAPSPPFLTCNPSKPPPQPSVSSSRGRRSLPSSPVRAAPVRSSELCSSKRSPAISPLASGGIEPLGSRNGTL